MRVVSFKLLFRLSFIASFFMSPFSMSIPSEHPLSTPSTPPSFPPVPNTRKPNPSLWSPSLLARGVPLPTNSFWTNLAVGSGKDRIVLHPYSVRRNDANNGIEVSHDPIRQERNTPPSTYVFTTFVADVSLTSATPVASGQVVGWDDLSVSLLFNDPNTSNSSLFFPLVRGCPFVTAVYTDLTPAVGSVHAIVRVNGHTNPPSLTATRFDLSLNDGRRWTVYAFPAITLTQVSATQLQASGRWTGTLRVVDTTALPSSSMLDSYARVWPVGGSVSYRVAEDETTADITYQWGVGGDVNAAGNLLMTCMPHHRDILVSPSLVFPAVSYRTLKGNAVAVVGNTWLMRERLTPITWHAPRNPAPGRVESIRQALLEERNLHVSASDPYFAGKQLARLASLVRVADVVGVPSVSAAALASLKNSIVPWLESRNPDALVYDQVWKGIVSTNGLNNDGYADGVCVLIFCFSFLRQL